MHRRSQVLGRAPRERAGRASPLGPNLAPNSEKIAGREFIITVNRAAYNTHRAGNVTFRQLSYFRARVKVRRDSPRSPNAERHVPTQDQGSCNKFKRLSGCAIGIEGQVK